jgi:hypothetical protein
MTSLIELPLTGGAFLVLGPADDDAPRIDRAWYGRGSGHLELTAFGFTLGIYR